jgi:hypothetical protein
MLQLTNMMNNNRDKFGWKLIYFDAFAGSGSRDTEQKEENVTELFDITEEDETVYRGANENLRKLAEKIKKDTGFYSLTIIDPFGLRHFSSCIKNARFILQH